MFLYYFPYNYFHHTWSKESPTDADLVTILPRTRSERLKPQGQRWSSSTSRREPMAPVPLMIVATVARESMVLLSSGLLPTRSSPRDKRLSLGLMVEFSALVVSSRELSEHSCWRKLKPSNKPRECQRNQNE